MKREKESKKGMFLVIFIAFIMISSVFAIIFSGYNQQTTSLKYNDIKFTRENNQWSTNINNQKLLFNYLPTEVEQINLGPDVIFALSNKPEIDTTSEINDTFKEEIALAQYNMVLALNNLNIYIRPGLTTNNTFNLPIITCEDASLAVPIIYFKQSNQTKITLENNCIIAEAKNNIDILRIKDRILYSILGII